MSCAWVAAHGYIHLRSGMPQRRAVCAEQSSSAAAWSTLLLEFISLGYGKETGRLKSLGVRISSAVFASRIQAWGLSAATRLNPAHSSETRSMCAASVSPRAWRMAFSKIGYIWIGCAMPRLASMRWRIFSSAPKPRSGSPGASRHCKSTPARRALAWVRPHSAPTSTTMRRSPRWISRADSVSTRCTESPPQGDTPVSAPGLPMASATALAGLRYGHMPRTTRTESTWPSSAGHSASAAASRTAAIIRSSGSAPLPRAGSASRCSI